MTLQIDTFSEPTSGYTGNVSIGGMFVAVEAPQPVGTMVRFELDLCTPKGVVRGTAEVAWIRARSRGSRRPAGMGLQFRHLQQDGEARLRAAVERIIEEEGLPPVPETGSRVAAQRAGDGATESKSRRSPIPPPSRNPGERSGPQEGRQPEGSSTKALSRLSSDAAKLAVAVVLVGVLLVLVLRLLG